VKKIKKYVLILISFCATTAFALHDFHNTLKPPEGTREPVNFSQLKWVDSAGPDGTYNPLSGMPGKADNITLRVYKINLDKDLTAGVLYVNGLVCAENKKFNFKGLATNMSRNQDESYEIEFKNCALNVSGGIRGYTLNMVEARGCGMTTFKFIDSTAKFVGLYELVFLNATITNTKPSGGMTLSLEGKSKIEFSGVLIDSYLKQAPDKVVSVFEFAENKGNLPELIFNGPTNDVSRSIIKVRVTPNAKVGKFPLITFASRGDVMMGEFGEIIINGKKVGFDEFREVGKFKAKVVKDVSPSGKDKGTKNDIVLIIENN